MASSRFLRGKLADVQTQMTELREQVQALTTDQLVPAATDWAGKTGAAARRARGVIADQPHVLSRQVNERPLGAILVAAVLGWAFARLMP
jgi:hypothetical protein